MKYLKKYNESDEYYQDITNKRPMFDKIEGTIAFDDVDKRILFSKGFLLLDDYPSRVGSEARVMEKIQSFVRIKITKTNDEYYIVSTYNRIDLTHRIFRCDQMSGLIKFLDDL